jgi:eukaryotic-like serine/threonine-protein kinase
MTSWSLADGDEIAPGRTAIELLGGGHRYEAYLAFDEHLRAPVVVKVVRPGQTGDERTLAGLAGEAEALCSLAHPMLPRIFDVVLDGPRPHIVLELVDGPRLSTLIRRYGVNIEQLLPLAVNLCAALHYMAREGWVHLDVKPRNVIMGGEPRLIDLSVARRTGDLAGLSGFVGTDAYMAPEQCDPARFGEIGPAADVWGLGVTVYEALAGQLPFPRRADEPHPQLRLRAAPLPDDIPPEVAEPVMACLDPDPASRPGAGEVADALEPVADGLPAPRIGQFRPGAKALEQSLDAR